MSVVAHWQRALKKQIVKQGYSPWVPDAIEFAGKKVFGAIKDQVKKRTRYGDLPSPEQTPKKKQKTKSYKEDRPGSVGLPKKKMVSKNVQNAIAGKVAVKITGKNGKRHKVKKVKVSRALRAKVKKVLAGQQALGSSIVARHGVVGSIVSLNKNTIAGDDLGGSGLAVYCPGQASPAGSRTLFNTLVTFSNAGNSVIVPRSGMNYFTPGKILDAASVLFNRKVRGDPYVNTNNLATYFNPATGDAQSTFAGPLVINVAKSYVTWTMKNLSDRVVTVDIWECTPKMKFSQINPLRDLISFYEQNAVSTSSADRQISYIGKTVLTTGGPADYDFAVYGAGTIDPVARAQQLGWQWKAKKRSMVMNPAETCVHSISGPSGDLNFKKLHVVDSAGAETFQVQHVKGWSVGCIVSIRVDQVISSTKVKEIEQRAARTAYAQSAAGNTQLSCPIAIEVKEVYSVRVPEVAGFVQNDNEEGTTQILNLRKSQTAIWEDMLGNPTEETGAYIVDNEENPLLDSTANPQFK